MEAELTKKVLEMYFFCLICRKESNQGTTGVLLVDSLGLPIESQGNFDKN